LDSDIESLVTLMLACTLGKHTRLLQLRHRFDGIIFCLAALLFAGQALLASPSKSASFAEQYHLTAGYTYLRIGDFRLSTTHPPLIGILAALPLLAFSNIALPLDDPAWAAGDRFRFSDVFLWEANSDSVKMVERARWPIVAVGVLLLAAIYGWSRHLWGPLGGIVALLLAAADPNLIFNSRVVTSDLGITTFLFVAVWLLWLALEKGGKWLWLGSGIAAGLAMSAKYSGVVFIPMALFLVLSHHRRSRDRPRWHILLPLSGAALAALLVLWTIYRWEMGVPQLPGWQLPVPAPTYWTELWRTLAHLINEQDVKLDFLLGHAGIGGWWYYLLVALLVKTPLPLILLMLGGSVALIARGQGRRLVALWFVLAIILELGMTGLLTIGYRHMLPALPFLIVASGALAPRAHLTLWTSRHWAQVTIIAVLVVWLLIESLHFFPDHEAYFNQLAGPWWHWSTILVDSNLDWGQDLPALRELMDSKGIERVELAYFGKAVPEKYGVRYNPLPSYLRFVDGMELSAYNPYTPEPGWYAISATSLGLLFPGTEDLYRYFQSQTPVARAGYSIYLYHVEYPPTMPVVRPVVAGVPIAQMKPADLGIAPGQRAIVKWSRSLAVHIYPLGQGYQRPLDLRARHTIFDNIWTLEGYTVDQPAATTSATTSASTDGLQASAGETMHLELHWTKGPAPFAMQSPVRGAPISTFVHVTTDVATEIVAQYDGWDVAMRGLEAGDVWVQPVEIALPSDLSPGSYTLSVDLYSPQTGARLPIITDVEPPDAVKLGVLRVRAGR
jgi:hypothetical protein